MSTIGGRTITEKSFEEFVAIYTMHPKPIFFWDTCGLLEIIRFVYRKNNGVATLNAISNLARKVTVGDIYCVTSELAAIEWDDNVNTAITDMRNSLKKTEDYHALAATTINSFIPGSAVQSDPISTFRLEDVLLDIALNIAHSSHFIKYEEIAKDTLTRVAAKTPPARDKRAEIKDCAFWETMLRLCRCINDVMPGGSPSKVFYTVNTDDFADKSRVPVVFFNELLAEARLAGFNCALIIDDAVAVL